MLYFFDSRDGPTLTRDDVGVELAGVEAARSMATRSLVDLVRDKLPEAGRRELAIEVRDTDNNDLFKASLSFAVSDGGQRAGR